GTMSARGGLAPPSRRAARSQRRSPELCPRSARAPRRAAGAPVVPSSALQRQPAARPRRHLANPAGRANAPLAGPRQVRRVRRSGTRLACPGNVGADAGRVRAPAARLIQLRTDYFGGLNREFKPCDVAAGPSIDARTLMHSRLSSRNTLMVTWLILSV